MPEPRLQRWDGARTLRPSGQSSSGLTQHCRNQSAHLPISVPITNSRDFLVDLLPAALLFPDSWRGGCSWKPSSLYLGEISLVLPRLEDGLEERRKKRPGRRVPHSSQRNLPKVEIWFCYSTSLNPFRKCTMWTGVHCTSRATSTPLSSPRQLDPLTVLLLPSGPVRMLTPLPLPPSLPHPPSSSQPGLILQKDLPWPLFHHN